MNYYLLFYYLQISTKQRQMHATVSYMLHAHTTPHSHHLPVDCYFILCIFYVSLHQNESKSDRLKMCSRLHAWRYWLKGMVFVVGSQQYRSKPFRKLTGRDLHSKQLKDDFKVNWKPILTKMEKAPGLTIPSRNNIDEAFIQTSYTITTDYLRECYSYIFAAGDAVVCDFTVGTWSFKTKRSEVLKKGTNADKSKLPAMTAKNNPHINKRTFSGGHARKNARKRVKKGGKKRDVLECRIRRRIWTSKCRW